MVICSTLKFKNKIKIKKNLYIEDSAHCFEGKYNNYLSGKWSDCYIFILRYKEYTWVKAGVITNNKILYKVSVNCME